MPWPTRHTLHLRHMNPSMFLNVNAALREPWKSTVGIYKPRIPFCINRSMKCKHNYCFEKKNINQCFENINVNCPLYMMHTVCFLLLYSLKVVLCDCEIFSISIPNCPSPIVLLYISVGHFVWKQCWILVYMSSPLFSASNMLALVSVLYKLDFFMFYYKKSHVRKPAQLPSTL
jgi:hypothetical protein